jgi:hypothetical protein
LNRHDFSGAQLSSQRRQCRRQSTQIYCCGTGSRALVNDSIQILPVVATPSEKHVSQQPNVTKCKASQLMTWFGPIVILRAGDRGSKPVFVLDKLRTACEVILLIQGARRRTSGFCFCLCSIAGNRSQKTRPSRTESV